MGRTLKWLGLGAVSLIGLGAQVSFEDAASNLASWWRAISRQADTPQWLTPQLDSWVGFGSVVLLTIALAASVTIRKLRDRRKRGLPVAPKASLITVFDSGYTTPPPELSEYLADEIARDLSRLHSKEYSADQVKRMYEDRGFDVRHTIERVYPNGIGDLERAAMDITGSHPRRNRYWITREDRARFERGESNWISLREAAVKAYEETQANSWHSLLAEKYKDVEGWYADQIVRGEKSDYPISVYGTKPPSTKPMRIPREHLKYGSIRNQGDSLESATGEFPTYTNLAISLVDFKSRVEQITQHFMGKQEDGNG